MHSESSNVSKLPNVDPAYGSENDFEVPVQGLVNDTIELYLADSVPWVVGYSGGKDSTATLQLVWMALAQIPKKQRIKPVHVISTDTLVENPIVATWVGKSLAKMNDVAKKADIPITSHRLTPAVEETFWVNLIGRGYPAPRPKFRWCTERLKIQPAHRFIKSVVDQFGEAILVLGTRKAESTARATVMKRHEAGRVRNRLSPNGSLPNSFIFSPIEDWSNDEVWLFLMQYDNPWGHTNSDLLTMYRGASVDGECPLVVDTGTPSCGDSRFGCWVCTLVEKDRSMQAMITNDEEKEWMLPLLELRNELDFRILGKNGDRSLRDFRRSAGHVQLFHDRPIPGPYRENVRHHWLSRVLEVEKHIRKHGPEEVREIELITMPELQEIRRIWLIDKHEIEDALPDIYTRISGREWPSEDGSRESETTQIELALLKEICGEDRLHFELTRELLSVAKRFSRNGIRRGIFNAIENALTRSAYKNEEEAIALAREREAALDQARASITASSHAFSKKFLKSFTQKENLS